MMFAAEWRTGFGGRWVGCRSWALGLFLVLLTAGCRSTPPAREVEAGAWEEGAADAEIDREARGYAHYAAGVLEELEGRPQEALDHYYEAAWADPLDETLVLKVTGLLLQARDSARAVALLEQCSRDKRAPASYLAWMGIAEMQRGNLDAAVAANRAALQRNPVFMLAYQNLVAIDADRKQPEALLAVIREAGAQTSGEAAYYVDVAELYAGYGRMYPDQADSLKPATLQALERAAELGSTDPFVVERLASGFKRMGEWQKAEAVYRTLLARSPGAPMVRESLVNLYLLTNNRKAAAELLQELIRQQPGNGRATYVLGSIALQENRLDEAEKLLEEAIRQEPTLEAAHYELAAVRLMRGKGEEALTVLDQARRRFRKSFVLEFYTGMAHLRAERYEAAARHFSDAEILAGATDPERLNHIFYFQFGAACERNGDRAAAEQHFRKCLELSPDFAEALNYLGYMWAERGEKLDEARTLIEKAVKLEPDNAAFLDSMGWVLFQLGKAEEALGWMQKAVEKSEEPDATLYDHLGDVWQATGQTEEARRAWQRSLELQESAAVRRKLGLPSESPPEKPGP